MESTFCLFPIGLLASKFSSTMCLLDLSELCRLSALLKAEFKISYKTTKNNVISKRFKPKKKMNTSHNWWNRLINIIDSVVLRKAGGTTFFSFTSLAFCAASKRIWRTLRIRLLVGNKQKLHFPYEFSWTSLHSQRTNWNAGHFKKKERLEKSAPMKKIGA